MPAIYVRADTGADANPGTELAPKQTLAAGLTALKAASGAGDKVLYLYQNAAETLAYNLTAVQTLGTSDNIPGASWRFEGYGPGRWPWVQALNRVTGWVDDGPGRARATFSGSIRTLWWGPNVKRLKRATMGEEQTTLNRALYRIQRWRENNDDDVPNRQTFDVRTDAMPSAAAITAGAEICIQIGWSLTKARVASATNLGGNLTRIVLREPERTVEFAKGWLPSPGLGLSFAFGPYHQDPIKFPNLENGAPNPGQRFWWESAAEFLTRPGDWHHDAATNTLRVQLPPGVANAAALDAAGVWVGNGLSTGFELSGSIVSERLTGVQFNRIGFRGFDWNWPNANGYVGYLGRGVAFRNGGGFMAFQEIPGVIYMATTDAVGFDDCVFRDLGGAGIFALYANSNLSVRNCLFKDLGACGYSGGGTAGTTLALQPWDYTQNINVRNNIFLNCGLDYPTAGASMGALRDFWFVRNTIDGTTSNGLDYNTDGRWYGAWQGNAVVEQNDIKRFMRWTQDTGGIYTSGNMSGFDNGGLPPVRPSETQGDRIVANWIGDSFVHDNDPLGGKLPCVYLDLGRQNALVMGNRFYNTPLAMKENTCGYNLFMANHVTGCNELRRTFYSGLNVWTTTRGMATAFINIFSVPYTLSFIGTGSITVSGPHSATLNGTGADTRVFLTFTPSASGTATFTPSGDVRAATLVNPYGSWSVTPTVNEIRQSATMSTQTRTLPAGTYTLSFQGTGSVAMTGGFSGTLNGVGAGTRVTRTFFCTSGGLTLTVSGSVTLAQLETGSVFTGYVPNTSATNPQAGFVLASGVSNYTLKFRGGGSISWSGSNTGSLAGVSTEAQVMRTFFNTTAGFITFLVSGEATNIELIQPGALWQLGQFILYEPPLKFPNTPTENAEKFYGLGAWTGRGFQSLIRWFPTPESVLDAQGFYNTSSTFLNNDALQSYPDQSQVGAPPEVFARFADQLG